MALIGVYWLKFAVKEDPDPSIYLRAKRKKPAVRKKLKIYKVHSNSGLRPGNKGQGAKGLALARRDVEGFLFSCQSFLWEWRGWEHSNSTK